MKHRIATVPRPLVFIDNLVSGIGDRPVPFSTIKVSGGRAVEKIQYGGKVWEDDRKDEFNQIGVDIFGS